LSIHYNDGRTADPNAIFDYFNPDRGGMFYIFPLQDLNDTTGVQGIGINKDSSNHEPDSLRKKGKKIFLIGLKKEMDYEFKSGNAEIPITIRGFPFVS